MPGTTTPNSLPYPFLAETVDSDSVRLLAEAVDTKLASQMTSATATTRRPAALVVRDSGTQSFATGAALANLTYTTERFDNNTMGNLGTNNERLTVVTAGVYCIYARVMLPGSNDDIGAMTLVITVGGTVLAGAKQRLALEQNVQLVRRLNAADIIRAQFSWSGAASPKNVTRAELGARWLCSL
jgi:hypothetical protein